MTEDMLITITALTSLILPNALLIFYIFQSELRTPIFLGSLILMLFIITESITGYRLGLNSQDFRILEFVIIPLYCIVMCACIRTQPTKLLFVLLLVASQFMGVRGIAAFLAIRFGHVQADNILYCWPTIIIQSILYVLLLPLTISLIKNCRMLISLDIPTIWNMLWLIPTLVFPFTILSWNLNSDTAGSLFFLITRALLLFSSFAIHHILTAFIQVVQEQLILKETTLYHKKIIDLQHYQYSVMQTQIEETRRARHDLRQHLNLIQAYLNTRNHEALQNYIDKYAQSLPKNSPKTYCKNYAVDTIIRYYAEQAEEANILFDCQLNLPQTLSIEEPDIAVLFGNLIENALEACQKLPTSTQLPFIRVRAQMTGASSYSITVDNSCAAAPVTSGEDFLSDKHAGVGIGTISIRHIASHYNGLTDFKYENGIFYASVFLNPQT